MLRDEHWETPTIQCYPMKKKSKINWYWSSTLCSALFKLQLSHTLCLWIIRNMRKLMSELFVLLLFYLFINRKKIIINRTWRKVLMCSLRIFLSQWLYSNKCFMPDVFGIVKANRFIKYEKLYFCSQSIKFWYFDDFIWIWGHSILPKSIVHIFDWINSVSK